MIIFLRQVKKVIEGSDSKPNRRLGFLKMKRKEAFFKFNQCAMCYHVFKKDEYDTGCNGDVVLRNDLIKIETGYGSRFDSANIFFSESHKTKGEKLIGKKVCDICISKELENGSLEYDFEDQWDYDDYHRIVSLGKQVMKKMADNWKNDIVRKEVETWLMVLFVPQQKPTMVVIGVKTWIRMTCA